MKARFSAVLLISMLVLAAFAPAAFAQAIVEDDGDDGNTVQIVDCSQVQSAFANQGQYGDANAAADDESEAVAEVAQELNISQSQVNSCLGGGTGGNNTPDPDRDGGGGDDDGNGTDDDPEVNSLPEGEDKVTKTVAAAELPETGGPSLLAAALGFALVAGGVALIRPRR